MAVDEPHHSAAHLPEHVAPSSCRRFRSAVILSLATVVSGSCTSKSPTNGMTVFVWA
jgi:hypothetical protein